MNLLTNDKHIPIWIQTIIIVCVLFVSARFVVVPIFLNIDNDFSYFGNLVSIDNFFDEKTNLFTGESLSVTTFKYDVLEKKGREVVVENVFDVRTIEGDTIVSINREYGIDAYTWKHVGGIVSKNREGNLFAPRHLSSKEHVDYWHVNYDTPIELRFVKEEILNGLKTYRYQASFSIDQTADLTHLPKVPEERGIDLDVSLDVWFEPVSGWLVKYEDNAIAYYYDQKTKERLHPWNKFSNTYKKESVNIQADKAKKLKGTIFFLEFLLPALVGIIYMLKRFLGKNKTVHEKIFSGLLLVGVIVVCMFIYLDDGEIDIVTIGIARWVSYENTLYDENIAGFKEAFSDAGYIEGENIIYITETASSNVKKQEEVAQIFLEKDVDLVYSLSTTGTSILKDIIINRPIVFSGVTYPVKVGFIHSLANSGNNLVGTRNWVSLADQLNIFMSIVPKTETVVFLHRKDDLNSSLQLEEMREVAKNLDVTILDIPARNANELMSNLFELYRQTEVGAVYSACDSLMQGEVEDEVIAFVQTYRIPSFSCSISGVQKGDLLAVVSDSFEIGKLAGEKAVKIIDGIPPSSLETNTSARPFLYVNKNTAKLLDIEIPQDILSRTKNIF